MADEPKKCDLWPALEMRVQEVNGRTRPLRVEREIVVERHHAT